MSILPPTYAEIKYNLNQNPSFMSSNSQIHLKIYMKCKWSKLVKAIL
jgi:hypothetical protein